MYAMPSARCFTALACAVAAFCAIAFKCSKPSDPDTTVNEDDMSLLQLASKVRHRDPDIDDLNTITGGIDWLNIGVYHGECGGPGWKKEDLTRPIREVLSEHPGVDGFLLFWMDGWLHEGLRRRTEKT